MEEEFFPDLEKMCRLCLCIRNDEELVGIFSQNGNNAGNGKGTIQMSIPMRIMACAALEVQAGDGLPKAICNECRYQLEKSYYFRKRSQLSDNKLRKHIRLLNLGKKSKVFQKNEDNDEEELEFEDSIIFIQKREEEMKAESNALCEQRLKNDFDQKIVQLKNEWMEQYKAELKDEVATELCTSVVAKIKQELRAEIEEEIKVQLRQECTEQAKEELRTEVIEECRAKERISLLDDLQVFLNQKKRDTVATKLNSAVVHTVVHTAIQPLEAQSSDMPEAADEAVRIELPSTSSSHEIIENEEMCSESDVENVVEDEPEFHLIEPMSNRDEEENEVVTTKSQRKRKSSQRFKYFEDKVGTANLRLPAPESSSREPGSDTYHIADTGQVQQYNYKDGQVLEKRDNEDIIADDFEDEQAEHLAQLKKPYAEMETKMETASSKKMKKWRKKMKENYSKWQQYKRKEAERKRKFRMKQKEKLKKNQNLLDEKREKDRLRQQRLRQKKKEDFIKNVKNRAYTCKQTKGKAMKKAEAVLPKNLRKK
ncbi:DNA ligase 1-like isoform X2 [Eurosta solidaginis]|uniref:DNA ligase 1-like isoform X2 n=1 Tax=Eurosta solidaginis TaxID=178769 RepID=UPI0035310EEA